jgi:hypothetical protein
MRVEAVIILAPIPPIDPLEIINLVVIQYGGGIVEVLLVEVGPNLLG